MKDLFKKTEEAWSCRLCTGAAYQVPPFLFAGDPEAPILVVGQNPGVIIPAKHRDKALMFKQLQELSDPEGKLLKESYDWDFGSSMAKTALAAILQKPEDGHRGWLQSGRYCYTNAVLCRTYRNEMPSQEMQYNCKSWTYLMARGRKAIVMMGSIAKRQFLKDQYHKLSFGEMKRIKNGQLLVSIPHYMRWRGTDRQTYSSLIDEMWREIRNG